MKKGRAKRRTGDPFTDEPRGGKLTEGDFFLLRLRKIKRRVKQALREVEGWEREIVATKRRAKKASPEEIALLAEMYEETTAKADELAARLEREGSAPRKTRRRPTTDDDLGV